MALLKPGLGLVIGYWVSDAGIAWMPTMLEVNDLGDEGAYYTRGE